jgi:hypothetical protein
LKPPAAEKGQIGLYCHGTAKRPSLVDKTYTPALTASTSYVPITWYTVIFWWHFGMLVQFKNNFVTKTPSFLK